MVEPRLDSVLNNPYKLTKAGLTKSYKHEKELSDKNMK